MSRIDKLAILGVRSFDNQRSETIQFFSPLTLVVGYNGSGKTTIIECLKYATTGLLPPNSKGGAFIHDPKLCGEKEVLAQVKLSFRATSGAKMVATRSVQLTVKKQTRSQKTLEGQLLMVKDGERTAISSRVAELDQILPQYLGVSQAILDNVIFCHQDESLWPMSEPSALKKKFDEIFEALKYTKAIDNIKQLRKKQNEELAKYKIMEQHAKEDKDKARKAEKRSIQLSEEIEGLRTECDELSRKMTQAAHLADKAWKESESFADIIGALHGKRIEAESRESTIKSLADHLKEVPESDQWIMNMLEQFDSRMEQYEDHKQAAEEEYHQRNLQLEGQRRELGQKLSERGKHEQDKAEYDRQLVRRINMVKEVASRHNMRGYDDAIGEVEVEEFMLRMNKLTKDQNAALDRARRDATVEKNDAQILINQLSTRKAALQQEKIGTKKQIALRDREASEVQQKIDEIRADEGSKAVIESRIEDAKNRMQTAREGATRFDWERAIVVANNELRTYEDESSHLNSELIRGTKKAGEMARIAHLKQELKERERSLKTMMGAHSERISGLLGEAWQPSTIERLHEDALLDRNRDLTNAERDRDMVAKDIEQLQYRQRTVRDDLKQKMEEIQDYEQQIKSAIDDEPAEYPDVLRERQTHYDMAKDDWGLMAGMGGYFQKLLDAANSGNPACRACERPFKTESEAAKFRKRVEGLIKKAEKDMEEGELKEAEEDLQTVRDVGLKYESWKKLQDHEIPALKREQEQLTNRREGLLLQIENHDKIVESRQDRKKELEQLSRSIASIAKCDVDIMDFERQIEDLSAKQSQSGPVRTLEDIQELLRALGDNIHATKQTISRLTSEREQSRTQIGDLELELRDLKNEVNTATFHLDKKASLVTRIAEIKASNQRERELLDKVDRDIEKLVPEISTAEAKAKDINQRAELKERELQRDASQLLDSLSGLKLLNEQIRSYIERGGPDQLPRTRRDIKTIEKEIARMEAEQNEHTRDINRISEQLRDSENTRRQYSDNLRYRQESRALEKVNAEIRELAAYDAHVDRERLQEESEKRTREHNLLSTIQAGKMGEMKSKDVQLVQLLADYETDFKDAPKRYKEAHIKVETTKAAVEDLGRYGGALDKAIMKYHSLKMAEINRIIEELWQRTYQGTDVDTIMIRSDNENTKGNRTYNYRVSMVKQDAEMDMRGRCSAGQKVLASILIRLALAECFGVNCGLIALDEPTTNLDRDNIRSLAESLHDIIKARQQQSNFQLIVITHDEEFLRHMQCGDFSDYYYRVSRNNKQKSIIERQSIAEVI